MSIAFLRSLPQTKVGETVSILAVFWGNKYQERRSELRKVGSGLIPASAAQRSQKVQKPRPQAEPLCPDNICRQNSPRSAGRQWRPKPKRWKCPKPSQNSSCFWPYGFPVKTGDGLRIPAIRQPMKSVESYEYISLKAVSFVTPCDPDRWELMRSQPWIHASQHWVMTEKQQIPL